MKLTFQEITNAHTALKALTGEKFDWAISLKLDKMEAELSKPSEAYRSRINELVLKYGVEKDGQTKVTDENLPTFYEEVNKDGQMEEDIPVTPIKQSLFTGYKIPKGFSLAMGKLIEEE